MKSARTQLVKDGDANSSAKRRATTPGKPASPRDRPSDSSEPVPARDQALLARKAEQTRLRRRKRAIDGAKTEEELRAVLAEFWPGAAPAPVAVELPATPENTEPTAGSAEDGTTQPASPEIAAPVASEAPIAAVASPIAPAPTTAPHSLTAAGVASPKSKPLPTAEEIAAFREPVAKIWATISKMAMQADPLAKEEIEALGDAWAPIAARYAGPIIESPWVLALGTTAVIFAPRIQRQITAKAAPAPLRSVG